MGPPPPPRRHPTSAAPSRPCSGAAADSWLCCFLHVRPLPGSLHLPKQGCTVALTQGWAHLQGPSHGRILRWERLCAAPGASGTRCAARHRSQAGCEAEVSLPGHRRALRRPSQAVSRQDGLRLPLAPLGAKQKPGRQPARVASDGSPVPLSLEADYGSSSRPSSSLAQWIDIGLPTEGS